MRWKKKSTHQKQPQNNRDGIKKQTRALKQSLWTPYVQKLKWKILKDRNQTSREEKTVMSELKSTIDNTNDRLDMTG